ncbi:hypothetical protein ACHWQZ_G009506 [Mnemiopsis leidyi]
MKSGQSEETFVNDSRNANLSLGDVWYVISQKWFDRWNRHVKYDGDHPGPIDNHDILLNAEISEVREEMLENIDFVFVPLECWGYLVKKYGTSSENTAIKRQVIEFGEFSKQLKIDLSGVKIEMVFGEIKIKRILSKSDTVEHLKELMDEVFHVKDTERRLWLKKLPNNYVLLKNDQDKLENFTLSGDNLVIILETKQSDGTWSEKYSSAAKVQTNFERNSSSAFGSHNLNHRSMESDTISTRSMTQANLTRTVSGGLVGLNNLGNTCFMASALQCLSNIPALTQFFISDAYESEINEKNPIGNRGDLARAYGDLMKQMWCGNSSTVAPRHFKSVLGRCAPQFSGYLQQDSQELMAFLLDGLHEDLNRITNKPYINQEDAPENTADSVAAQRAWDNHKKRNDSIITDLFHGQYRSRLECPDCMKVSKIFDPLMYMSVSLPRKEEKIREIDIIWLDPQRRRTRYKIITPREGQVIDLLYAAEKVSGLSADRMMLCELSQAIIESTISPTQKLRDIRDGRYSLCIFEREPQLPVIKVYNAYKGYTSYLKYFGNPLIMQIPKKEMSFNDFVISLTTKMSRYVHLTEEAVQSEDSLPFKIKAVNQFGVEQSHDLCDEDDNLSVHMSSGKPVAYIALVWDMDAKDEYFKLDECNAVDYHDSYRTTKARKNEVLLEDCIEMYCKQETLNEDNMWYCPNCKDFKQASKKLDLWKLPKVLVIHLKRFCYSRHWRDKIETMVKFPLHDLSLKKFMLTSDQSDIKYDLRGVVNHYGGLGGGHYTAYCHSVADDKWHVYDDSHVASCTAEKCNSPSAYVLFYTQQEGSRLNGSSNGFEPMDVN